MENPKCNVRQAEKRSSSNRRRKFPPAHTFELSRRLLETLGFESPPTLADILTKNGDFVPTSGSAYHASAKSPAAAFRAAYLAKEVFSKYSDGSTSEFTKSEAYRRFNEAEHQCGITNKSFWNGTVRHSPHWHLILDAREQILRLIGASPCLDEVSAGFDWGPGATTRLTRSQSDAAYKFSGQPETTAGNLVFAHAAIRMSPLWKSGVGLSDETIETGFTVVAGNKVITVPKSRKTDRCIAIEPDMNIFVQKGFGAVLRRRLRSWSIDLNDQRPNQDAAFIGSTDGSLATIDLSMASDTISRGVVEALLPPLWVTALEQCRSTHGLFEDKLICYQKFSSMGNGFTFELETLIFASLARAIYRFLNIEGRPLVYGDDIIVSDAAATLLLSVLDLCGFSVNTKKSHWSGPFRESCGSHYLKGEDVTPFYIRRPMQDIADVLLNHNNLVRWMRRGDLDRELFEPILSWLVSLLPRWLQKTSIPDGLGDFALIGDEIGGVRHSCWEGFRTFLAWSPFSTEVEVESGGLLLKALYRLDRRGSFLRMDSRRPVGIFPVRQGGYGKRKLTIYCSR